VKTSLSFLIFLLFVFFSGDTHTVFFKDLNEDVIGEMESRIKVSDYLVTARILQSFGIPSHLSRRFRDVFHFFPDTPVKLLRDVCEALQLYDLVDLLEIPIPRGTKSLRPVLTLGEVRKLGKIDGRPISHHSRAAVLIFADSEDCPDVKSCESFFKSLNNKSEVAIVRGSDHLLKVVHEHRDMEVSELRAKLKVQGLNRSIENVKRGTLWQQLEQQTEIMKLTSRLQMQRQTVEQLEKELEEIKAKERKEKEKVETAVSKVIEKWIQLQGW